MKKFLLFFVLLSSWGYTRAQLNVSVYDSITVLALNGDTLRHAWTGGVNSPQFSEVDLNLDGINDLFIFDRSINRITTFINKGTPNKVDYQLAHGYEQQLPPIKDWALFRDYNCDGKMDLFTYETGGIKVYKNTSTSTQLQFTLATTNNSSQIIFSNYNPDTPSSNPVNLYVSSIDIPAIVDVDGDGDMDVLTFSILGSQVEYHKNLSMELYGTCDSLEYEIRNKCWGFFSEGSQSNAVILDDTCGFNINNPERISGGSKHAGSTLFTLDIDSSGSQDLVLGDVSHNNLVMLTNNDNTPNLTASHMIASDTTFPSNNANTLAVDLYLFPAG